MSGELCGKWMPQAKTYCGRKPLHKGIHATPEALARQAANRPRKTTRRRGVRGSDNPIVSARWKRNTRLARYGLTQETFNALLEAQGHACGMCHEPFTEGQQIFIDHDHNLGCHPEERRACDKCRRGLLCLRCNTGLGYVERMLDLARAYLERVSGALVVW